MNALKNNVAPRIRLVIIFTFLSCNSTVDTSQIELWTVITQEDWYSIHNESKNLTLTQGEIHIEKDSAFFSTKLKKFDSIHSLESITVKQNSQWNNWQAIPKITPISAIDAPVFIPITQGNYWLLARHLDYSSTGYHAWHSTDMKSWTHHGLITSKLNRWVSTAEYVDGKFYIYFDKPNDEETHLIIDNNLSDGKQGTEIGMVFDNPSHGSDAGIFRDSDGTFHLIYEDWSPINPSLHSWDSPLAGHAVSHNGIHDFKPYEYPPPIDERSIPTGEIEFYEPHPSQLSNRKNFSPYSFEVHQGPQDAFGDYTIIKVGTHYYIFGDYHPHEIGKTIRIGRWRSDNINKPFIWDGEIGEDFHPDPTIGFAEGKFYLIVQRNNSDYISDGPWIDGVEIRVGVDIDNDEEIDSWTPFTKIKEVYSQKKGFSRIVEVIPATLETLGLEAGYAFKLEILSYSKDELLPIINSFEAVFKVH